MHRAAALGGRGHRRELRLAFRSIPDATVAAYAGLPAALIWDAERTGA
jgi:hypothetical protein